MPEKRIYSVLKSFPKGINSDVDPLLLPPDQLSFAVNSTVRGDFVSQRPNFFNLTLTDANSGVDLAAFQSGLYQGACYYRTTTNGYIMVAVNGNLFQIAINPATSVATITQVTTPQQNSITAVKHALWQAQQFLIWSDGIALPTFYDGASARLSLGGVPTPLGSTAADFNIPVQNQYVIGGVTTPAGNVAINAPWTAGQGMVMIGTAATPTQPGKLALYYVAGWSGGGSTANATLGLAALTSASGLVIPVGTEAYLNTKYCGVILDAFENDGVTPQVVFPPEPVASTPGDSLVLKVLTPATTPANGVPISNSVASSKYYAGIIDSVTRGGGVITNYPSNLATQITLTMFSWSGIGNPQVGHACRIYNSYYGTVYASGQIISLIGTTGIVMSFLSG